jgi:hypothetical protein
MDSSIDQILRQYGLGTPTAGGAIAQDNLGAQSTPPPGTAPVDPAQGQDPMGNLRQAVAYAKQLGEQAKSSIHAGAKVAASAPGAIGAIGSTVAQATAPEPQASSAPPIDASTVASLIRHHESGGNYAAVNHDRPGNTASGAYQYTDPTWAGYGGYRSAALAPRAIQDQRAQEDIARSLQHYGGDAFKAIAHHYLPAAANNPASWSQPYKLPNGQTVAPVADYVKATVANTPLQGQLDAYLRHYSGQSQSQG